jgi:hypothetical protein
MTEGTHKEGETQTANNDAEIKVSSTPACSAFACTPRASRSYFRTLRTVSACLLQTDAVTTATTKALCNTLAARDTELGRLKSVLKERE